MSVIDLQTIIILIIIPLLSKLATYLMPCYISERLFGFSEKENAYIIRKKSNRKEVLIFLCP